MFIMVSKVVLSLSNLHVKFKTLSGTVNAVRGISYDLYEGETLALVGESGSGKSVSTKAITKVLPQNATISGDSIIYQGEDLLKKGDSKMNKIRGSEIAMIFQDPMTSLNPILPVGFQIAEPIIEHQHLSKEKAKEKAIKLMERVGIVKAEERYSQYPHQFSGGMRQRVMIALAVACHPHIMIADEPTTALDVTIQAQIIELLKELNKEFNMSTIFITHDMGVVANIADRIAVMYAGKIVEFGTANEIFFNPKHPYTWGLLMAVPDVNIKDQDLYTIPGMPPNLLHVPKGDPFAFRNKYALNIDLEKEPPMFKVSDTHYAATWLLDEKAPKVEPPKEILDRWKYFENHIENMQKKS
ncbi:ABC superfamily ATP binding cassette transporter, ABC protein [Liquorilactobacillus satsumensis DSM 16230 = JCM 12392]|uniref:ABC superfamily ATP binding cassette transporter, ABC protein n=2 Tax=Lactobacillales TaxID=186826 RepID=A0A0R1V677_9LACO|nr:ABC superfamily ATP binding cassette transporter, ABC protein [Liquorilactobacillus satsumensis DSM 16230 = JCM 12392]